MTNLKKYLPFWEKLSQEQKKILENASRSYQVKKDYTFHGGSDECAGLLIITGGQVRVFIITEDGKEITLYRLFDFDICLFSASCAFQSLQYDIYVQAEVDTEVINISSDVYQKLMKESAAVSNYTNELLMTRFSDVMWLLDQILSRKMDARLCALLWEECQMRESDELEITHDILARHLGTAREVVTRMLKYLQNEKIVSLSRGKILILDQKRLQAEAVRQTEK